MIIPPSIRRKFSNMEEPLKWVAVKVRDTVLTFCDQQGYAYVGRRKTLESLAEKIETGRFARWSDIDDLFGCCVVVPTLAHEPGVLDFLQTAFNQTAIKARGATKKSPDTFRFDATRFYGRLRPPNIEAPVMPVHQICFEIQVRTAFEHAWSVTTHSIYKSGDVNWKTKRVAAQLKAIVEQMDAHVLAFEQSAEGITEHPWAEVAQEKAIAVRLSDLALDGTIPLELIPKDWSRFAENLRGLLKASSAWPRDDAARDRYIAESLNLFESEIRLLGSDRVPRSMSIFQFALGVLTRNGRIKDLNRFVPLITDELVEYFPETKVYDMCFDFENYDLQTVNAAVLDYSDNSK